MFKYFTYLSILQQLVDLIKGAEQKFKEPGTGPSKAQYVVAQFVPLIQAAANAGLIQKKLADALVAGATAIIDVVVQVMNAVGAFHDAHQPQPAPAPTPSPAPSPAPPPGTYFTIMFTPPKFDDVQNGDRVWVFPNASSPTQWWVYPRNNGGLMEGPPSGFVLGFTVQKQ